MASVRRSLRLSLLVAGALALGCAGLRPAPAPLHPQTPRGSWYIVQPGETLASIATRTGVPAEDLAEINGVPRSAALEAGRLIFLLEAESSPAVVTRASPLPAVTPPSMPPPRPAPPPERPAPAAGWVEGPAPLRWPLTAPVLTSPFGARQGRVHEGIDLSAPTGTPIHAADAGQVLYAGDAVRGYGNMIVIQHLGDILTVYAHASVLLVRTGDKVTAGREIARVGQSGRATAPHLHFEVRRGQVPQDPLRFLPGLAK